MENKRKLKLKKHIWSVIVMMFIIVMTGCNHTENKETENINRQEDKKVDQELMKLTQEEEKEIEDIISICLESYTKGDDRDELEVSRELVNTLGENGYTAVDSENQINMAEYEKMIQFCEKVETKESGRITIVEVVRRGNYIIRTWRQMMARYILSEDIMFMKKVNSNYHRRIFIGQNLGTIRKMVILCFLVGWLLKDTMK